MSTILYFDDPDVGLARETRHPTFARIAAKVPARRIPQVVERLIDLYDTQKQEGENAPAFFQRLEVPRVKTLLADLEHLTPEDAVPDDFIDLAESGEFAPEVMEGECSA